MILISCYSLLSRAQVLNSTGGKITISGGAMTVKGKMLMDTASVIQNSATLKTDSLKNAGDIRLTGNAAQMIIDSGVILQKGVLQLNSNKLVLLNSDTNALQVTNGKLIAEDSLWGKVVWHLGEQTGKRRVSFKNDSLQDVSIEFEVIEAGTGTNGYIEFSTFETLATDNPNNSALPPDMLYFQEAAATVDSNWQNIADRYWLTKAVDYTTPPLANITLRYADKDIAGTNTIAKSDLRLSLLRNRCWEEVPFEIDTTTNTLSIDSLSDYSIWLLHDSIEPQTCYSGLTCGEAIKVSEQKLNGPFLMADTTMWFEFETLNRSLKIICSTLSEEPEMNVLEMTLYQDSCGIENAIANISLPSYADSLVLSHNPFSENTTYLLRLSQALNKKSIFNLRLQGLEIFCQTAFSFPDSGSARQLGTYDFCDSSKYYAPDENYPEHLPMKIMYVNFHFIQKSDGTGNFTLTDDGMGDASNAGLLVADRLLDGLNALWASNQDRQPVYSPQGVQVKSLETRIRFEVYSDSTWEDLGLYFHQSDSCFRYNYCEFGSLKSRFSVHGNKVLDIFLFAEDEDPNYDLIGGEASISGIVTINNFYLRYRRGEQVWNSFLGIISHEIGHTLQIHHVFPAAGGTDRKDFPNSNTPDGCLTECDLITGTGCMNIYALEHTFNCLDIDADAECNYNPGAICSILYDSTGNPIDSSYGRCDTWSANPLSNNMMGYNNAQNFLTPCQIGGIHDGMVNFPRPFWKKDYCQRHPNTNQDIIIYDGDTAVWHSPRYLKRDLIIKSGGKLTIQCLVGMPEGAKIIVERGGKLIIDGGTITNVCGDMWAGIEVWGNSSQPHPTRTLIYSDAYPTANNHENEQGVLILMNGAVIENAYQAVECLKRYPAATADLNYTGGIVFAENSIFRNNKTAVGFNPFNFNYNSYFQECTFETTTLLNDPTAKPYSFITMWDVSGITFAENIFRNTAADSFAVHQRGRGIISTDARYFVTCTDFHVDNCLAPADSNLFQNLYMGVQVKNTYGSVMKTPVIANGQFTGNANGVMLSGVDGAQVYRNHFELGDDFETQWFLSFAPKGIFALASHNIILQENHFVLPDSTQSRAVYFLQSQRAQEIYNNTVEGGELGYAFAYSLDNGQLVNYCNTVEDPMEHFLIFSQGSLYPFQGFCEFFFKIPAGNVFDTICSGSENLQFYTGNNVASFKYCNQSGSGLKNQCIEENTPFARVNVSEIPSCTSKIIGLETGGPNPDDFYGLRPFQDSLSGLIRAQYNLLDSGKTDYLVSLTNNLSYSANQLADTLIKHSPFLSDDVLVALLFRPEFNVNKLSNILIRNAPHSNLILKAIDETNPPMHNDSLDKLKQYQDSTSARKPLIDSLSFYKLQKSLNYSLMLYYATVDTNYEIEEVKDSLMLEKEIPLRFLLADLYMDERDYTDVKIVYDSLKVYFREDKKQKQVRGFQYDLFSDEKTYYDIGTEGYDFEADLEEIAFGDSSIAAFQARNILEFIRDTIYMPPYQDKEEGSPKTTILPKPATNKIQDPEISYKLIPTLIDGEVVGRINIGSEETGYLEIYTTQGKKLGVYQLNEGTNSIPYSDLMTLPGVYIYRVYVNSEIKNTDKLVKIN